MIYRQNVWGEVSSQRNIDNVLDKIFPKDIFGEIPDEVKKLLQETGFTSLVSLITLNGEDISSMEATCSCKLKFGHKRYLTQMIDYAKKAIGNKLEPDKVQTSEETKRKLMERNKNREKCHSKRGTKRKFDKDENVSTILERSLKKTVDNFSRENKTGRIVVPVIDIVRSDDNTVEAASLMCTCGREAVHVYVHSTKRCWVTSNYLRHLNSYHKPELNVKITNFLKPISNNGAKEKQNEKTDNPAKSPVTNVSQTTILSKHPSNSSEQSDAIDVEDAELEVINLDDIDNFEFIYKDSCSDNYEDNYEANEENSENFNGSLENDIAIQLDKLSTENEALKNILSQYRSCEADNPATKELGSASEFVQQIFEVIDTKQKTAHSHIAKYDDRLKQFSTYLYCIGGKLTYETLAANLSLPSVATVKKEIQSFNAPIIEGKVRSKELGAFLIKRNLPMKVWLSEDSTKNVNKIEYDETTDQLVGLVLPMDSNGMPIPFSFSSESVFKMQHSLLNYPKAEYAYTVMSRSLNVNSPSFCLSLFGTDNKFNSGQVLKRWAVTESLCEKESISIFGWSSDGDSRCLQAMRVRSGLGYHPENDTHHVCSKMKARLYDSTAVIIIGNFIASKNHLKILMDTVSKDKHLLVPSDIRPFDKMNFKPVLKIMNSIVRSHLKASVPASLGTSLYLGLMENVYKSYLDENLVPLERVYCLWYTIFFLRIWRIWLVQHKKYSIQNFITYNTYACIELNGHSLINIILSLAAAGDDEQFITTLMGSQTCEELFRRLRSLTTMSWTEINFTMLQMLHKIHRIEFIEEAMEDLNTSYEFPRKNTKKQKIHQLPSQEEIFEMVTKAKEDALKVTEAIGMKINQQMGKNRKIAQEKTTLSCQLSSIVLKSYERGCDPAEYFEDEDTYPNDYDDDDEVSDESRDESVDEQESREEEIRKPENIDSILKAHGGSLNLKEITNVKAKNCFLIKNGNGEAVSIKKNNSAGFSTTNIKK
ncbi:hypothetical protein Bhyg_04672 [Pseudolycoriella hygida]|uniref:Uncharacterized protein n=1 Tax=Pseudolycoriella hygida TaxID=35572 RepID=A0A9Q0NGE6_9DIPT|nr:hypothetical protein Bhyg_04672 [Pseudolycoriella hygida]